MIQRRNRADAILEPIVTGEKVFDGYDPANISDVPLLFQTGYLTIKQKKLTNGRARYTLGVPNSEVNEALMTCLLQAYGKYPDEQIDSL